MGSKDRSINRTRAKGKFRVRHSMRDDLSKEDQLFWLWSLLHQTSFQVAKCRQRELRKLGLSMMQSALLFVVKDINGPATPAEISRRLLREPNTVTVMLQNMEDDCLLTRTKDLETKNLVRIEITKQGEQAYQTSRENREVVWRIMSCLSKKERLNLWIYLQKIRNKALAELGVEYKVPFP
jgi:DNA-binding MarR family transcriptional regulator